MADPTALTPDESHHLARLRSALNGPIRSSLNTLSVATSLVAAEELRMRPRGQEALHLLCQEVEWHQSLWLHVLRSLDAVANAQELPPLPARTAGG